MQRSVMTTGCGYEGPSGSYFANCSGVSLILPESSSGLGGSGSSSRTSARRESRTAKATPTTTSRRPRLTQPHHGSPPKKLLLGSFVTRLIGMSKAQRARIANSCDFFIVFACVPVFAPRETNSCFGDELFLLRRVGRRKVGRLRGQVVQERAPPLATRERVLHVARDAVGLVRRAREDALELAALVAGVPVVADAAGRPRRVAVGVDGREKLVARRAGHLALRV